MPMKITRRIIFNIYAAHLQFEYGELLCAEVMGAKQNSPIQLWRLEGLFTITEI